MGKIEMASLLFISSQVFNASLRKNARPSLPTSDINKKDMTEEGHQESVCHACAQPGWMEKLLLKGSNA